MKRVRGVVVVGSYGEVDFVVAEVVGFGSFTQPGELHFMAPDLVREKGKDETLVRGFDAPHLTKAQCLGIKGAAFIKVEDVDVVVVDKELHLEPRFSSACLIRMK